MFKEISHQFINCGTIYNSQYIVYKIARYLRFSVDPVWIVSYMFVIWIPAIHLFVAKQKTKISYSLEFDIVSIFGNFVLISWTFLWNLIARTFLNDVDDNALILTAINLNTKGLKVIFGLFK